MRQQAIQTELEVQDHQVPGPGVLEWGSFWTGYPHTAHERGESGSRRTWPATNEGSKQMPFAQLGLSGLGTVRYSLDWSTAGFTGGGCGVVRKVRRDSAAQYWAFLLAGRADDAVGWSVECNVGSSIIWMASRKVGGRLSCEYVWTFPRYVCVCVCVCECAKRERVCGRVWVCLFVRMRQRVID
jgi:hypothetical protein